MFALLGLCHITVTHAIHLFQRTSMKCPSSSSSTELLKVLLLNQAVVLQGSGQGDAELHLGQPSLAHGTLFGPGRLRSATRRRVEMITPRTIMMMIMVMMIMMHI